MAGVLFERNLDKRATMVKSAKSATVDFDGGNILQLTRGTDDVYVGAVPTAVTGLFMAYNPSVRYIKIGNKIIAGQSITEDPRDYTNLATIPFDVFKPEIEDEIGLLQASIEGVTAPTVGEFLIAVTGKKNLTISATAPASTLAWEVVAIGVQPYPNAVVIGNGNLPLYILKCVAN